VFFQALRNLNLAVFVVLHGPQDEETEDGLQVRQHMLLEVADVLRSNQAVGLALGPVLVNLLLVRRVISIAKILCMGM
jgi:hypothetical protein